MCARSEEEKFSSEVRHIVSVRRSFGVRLLIANRLAWWNIAFTLIGRMGQ